jgi:hypothetical protein
MPGDTHKSDARRVAEIRDILPTTLGSAEIRETLAVELRARGVFSARTANAVYLSKLKQVIDAVANGEMNVATARVTLMETLRAIGYTPEGGFPDDAPGSVPDAIAGTLQDLGSKRRLDLIIQTQMALMAGRGWQLRGMEAARMAAAPAWELVRIGGVEEARDWPSRWAIAGGKPRLPGFPPGADRFIGKRTGFIALKGDPVWGELGSSENFKDALDTDHPPWAFNSQMGWQEVGAKECAALGITGPDGETIREWLAMEHPVLGTPPPQISTQGMDPAMVRRITVSIPAVEVEGTLTTPANEDLLRRRLAARRAAIAARAAVPIHPQP